jgi:hypothetical protein
MLDYREQISSIYNFLKRSEAEQKYPYAYEIVLLTGIEETALTSRTSGSSKFNQDIENGVEKAKQAHGMLRVDVYGGKSPNARKLNTYTVNVSGLLNPPKPTLEKEEIQSLIKAEINQIPKPQNGLGDLNSLLGMFTGNSEGLQGIEGLFGLFNTISGNNKELDRISYQKQLDDFKFESRFNLLQERYEQLRSENAELRVEKERFLNENKELKTEKTDLENRLAGYAPNELMKRVAIGAVATLGGRLLSNSPKTAELLGLSPQELKGALGIVDEPMDDTSLPQTNVEISEIGAPQSPEDKKKAEIIKNLSDALATWDLPEVAKIANIVGLCLDKAELINQTLAFLSQSMKGSAVEQPEAVELENSESDN